MSLKEKIDQLAADNIVITFNPVISKGFNIRDTKEYVDPEPIHTINKALSATRDQNLTDDLLVDIVTLWSRAALDGDKQAQQEAADLFGKNFVPPLNRDWHYDVEIEEDGVRLSLVYAHPLGEPKPTHSYSHALFTIIGSQKAINRYYTLINRIIPGELKARTA